MSIGSSGSPGLALVERLVRVAIRRHRLLVVLSVGVLVLAQKAWTTLPRLEDPDVDPAHLSVTLVYPGASPEDVEQQVVKPVEDVLYGLDGVEYVEATAAPNVATFHLKLEEGTPMDLAVERVRGKVSALKRDLPPEVEDPEVVRFSTTNSPQIIVAVHGARADAVLTDEAERIKADLAGVDGVSAIDLRGESEPVIDVRIDPARLALHGVTVDGVAAALRAINVRVAAGDVRIGELDTMLTVRNAFDGFESVANVPLRATVGGAGTIRLRDVADVTEAAREPEPRFLYDGRPAVALEIRFRSSENAVAIGDAVRARLAESARSLPDGVAASIAHDQPEWIARSLDGFVTSLLEGIFLVVLVISLGMGARAAAVASASLPLAVGATLFGLYVLGFALEQITIAGLIVALGLLVDDSIVVTESIERLRERGFSGLRAAVVGSARVFAANHGTTAVACAAFLPLFFMDGATGLFIRGLPTAVVLALVSSLVIAQWITPWLATVLLRRPPGVSAVPDDVALAPESDETSVEDERNPVLRAIGRAYLRVAPGAIRRPFVVVAVSAGLLVASLSLLPRIGFQFFPKSEKPALFVSLDLPRGTPSDVAAERAAEALRILRAHTEVVDTSAVVGGAYAPILYSRVSRPSSDLVDIFVRLRPGVDTSRLAGRLRRELADVVGVAANVEELYYGPPVSHPILVRLYGDDYERLARHAAAVRARIEAEEGTINVRDSLSDSIAITEVTVDDERSVRAGITPIGIGRTLRLLHGDDAITDFRVGDDRYEVHLDDASPEEGAEGLRHVRVASATSTLVPLASATSFDVTHGHAELLRRNKRRIVEVTADVAGNASPTAIVGRIDRFLRARRFESGYGFMYAGVQEETEKSFASLGLAAVGALILIFGLLVLMFDRFRHALVVIAAVPFGLVGALPGLYLTGNPFGFMAFLGLIALLGVYVNHKIYFVDRFRELRARGDSLEDALVGAGRDRLRPVVLTALTAVLGLLPLTLGGGVLWSAFGWVNIFGLVASIPLSLLVLPAMIALVDGVRLGLRWR